MNKPSVFDTMTDPETRRKVAGHLFDKLGPEGAQLYLMKRALNAGVPFEALGRVQHERGLAARAPSRVGRVETGRGPNFRGAR